MLKKIFDTLKARLLLLLLLVAVVGLSSGLFARELIISDFRKFMEGKLEDRTYLVMAKLEGNYENNGGWVPQKLADDVIWALLSGQRVSISDVNGIKIMDADQAIAGISPAIRSKISTLSTTQDKSATIPSSVYPLFSQGKEIGTLTVDCAHPNKELVFIERTNRLLGGALLGTAALALILSLYFSRKIVKPITDLTLAARAVRDGEEPIEVPAGGSVEFRELAYSFNTMTGFLRRQEELRRTVLANTAHELRTPITVMRVQLEAMSDGLLPADVPHLNGVISEIDRFANILNGLNELNQAEASALTLKRTVTILRPFLQNHIERFNQLSGITAPRIELQCDDKLQIYADPERLSQIVINLVSNACKATSLRGNIIVSATSCNYGVTLSVWDSGSGIEEKDLPFIFERFYHGFEKGRGLGLAIVKELVTAHGGKVSVESWLGEGSSFKVFLPDENS